MSCGKECWQRRGLEAGRVEERGPNVNWDEIWTADRKLAKVRNRLPSCECLRARLPRLLDWLKPVFGLDTMFKWNSSCSRRSNVRSLPPNRSRWLSLAWTQHYGAEGRSPGEYEPEGRSWAAGNARRARYKSFQRQFNWEMLAGKRVKGPRFFFFFCFFPMWIHLPTTTTFLPFLFPTAIHTTG